MAKKNVEIDRLAEATGGRLHWDDPGMDDFEKGWEEFTLGTRVEVMTENNIWRKGTVVETINENDRGIHVECDDKWHDNLKFLGGRGATVMVYMNTRRGILSRIRLIDEPRRNVVIPRREPRLLTSNVAELLKIAEIAVQHSGGRLCLLVHDGSAARFLRFDGEDLGRDIELYGLLGDVAGWQQPLAMFLEETLLPIKKGLPESYAKAGEALRQLGESVYPKNLLKRWRDLF